MRPLFYFIQIATILLAGPLHAQNIFSALHLNDEREYKTVRPIACKETRTYYNENGTRTEYSVKTYDPAGMILTETRYNEEGTPTAKLTYTNDTARRLKRSRILERWTPHHMWEKAIYTYDANNSLILITDQDSAGNMIDQFDIIDNEKGDPVSLKGHDRSGPFPAIETATYLYPTNQAVTTVDNSGSFLSIDTIKIRFCDAYLHPLPDETYNEKGDLIHYTSKSLDGTRTTYAAEYSYDSNGNCIEEKRYRVTIRRNREKRRPDATITRVYTY